MRTDIEERGKAYMADMAKEQRSHSVCARREGYGFAESRERDAQSKGEAKMTKIRRTNRHGHCRSSRGGCDLQLSNSGDARGVELARAR
jgi:hypothetical protein